jgi:hypothetical protein
MFTPSFTPMGEHSLLFRRMEGQIDDFTPGDNFTTRGEFFKQIFAPTEKLAPRGKVGT